jgi:hypothetical protein
MKRLVITDTHTPLGLELLARFLEQGNEVIAVQSGKESGFKLPRLPAKPLAVIYWKKASSLSSRNLIITCKSICSSLDGAVLLNMPADQSRTFEELTPTVIEEVIDRWLKGPLFLVKDFLDYFTRLNRGMLAVITCSPQADQNTSLLGGGLYPYFEHVLTALLKLYKDREINLHGFFVKHVKEEITANYIIKNITEKCYKSNGRLFHI